jgi:RimJ/RimL family protein N-acetyltransferase
MKHDFLSGQLVELTPVTLENDLPLWEKWDHDSEYQRQLNLSPARCVSSVSMKKWFEKEPSEAALFSIRERQEGKVIGFVELDGYEWSARTAWVGIAIGEAEYRGKGYGTEAMNLLLKFAFRALNLHRVNLNVFDFNKRAIRSYEKSGFHYEGTSRECIYKEDQRWDVLNMGILQRDWEALQSVPAE